MATIKGRRFTFGSLAVTAIWLAYPFGFVHAHQVSEFLESTGPIWYVDYAAVFVLFAAGETQRTRLDFEVTAVENIECPDCGKSFPAYTKKQVEKDG